MTERAASPLYRCGTVAVAGRPNVGKSSLLNRLLDFKVSIVSEKPQTTRNIIPCVYNGPDFQAVFLDTPGIHIARHKLGKTLVESATQALNAADVICYVVEAGDRTLSPEDEAILELLAPAKLPVILVMNKCDAVRDRETLKGTKGLYEAKVPLVAAVAVSARSGEGLPLFLETVRLHLPQGLPFYDGDMVVDRSERFIASEIIREKVLMLSHQEVPHSVAVEIEEYKSPEEYPERRLLLVRATLYVEREGQKRILIGDRGTRIREIGRLARGEIEALTGHKAFLDLWVKVRPGWKESDADLRMLGIKEKLS